MVADNFDGPMEEEAQGRDPRGWAGMGGLPDPSARERVIQADEIREVRKGTQQGRSKPPSEFVTVVPGRGGLKIIEMSQIGVPVKPGCVLASIDVTFDGSQRVVVNFRTERAETITAHEKRCVEMGRDMPPMIVNA